MPGANVPRAWVALLVSACTAPPTGEVVELREQAPEQPAVVFPRASRPEALAEPRPPPGYVGPNPGCPRLRVFRDEEDLCERGILPLHPFGRCTRMPRHDDDDLPVVHAKRARVEALGGSAELFVKHYIGGGDSDNETVHLALRGVNGYVLLATVADYHSQANDAPKFERFVGDDTSVTIRTLQEWWTLDGASSELRRESVRCTLGEDGGIRCNGACPQLAVVEPVSAVDCAAIARFDGSQLSRGDSRNPREEWGGRWEDEELWGLPDFLGLSDDDDGSEPPRQLRKIEIEGRTLSILEVERGHWALLHGYVPLLASDAEIRVGPGPGGVYVSSESAGQRRLHRLHLATHELEPILPGRCG